MSPMLHRLPHSAHLIVPSFASYSSSSMSRSALDSINSIGSGMYITHPSAVEPLLIVTLNLSPLAGVAGAVCGRLISIAPCRTENKSMRRASCLLCRQRLCRRPYARRRRGLGLAWLWSCRSKASPAAALASWAARAGESYLAAATRLLAVAATVPMISARRTLTPSPTSTIA